MSSSNVRVKRSSERSAKDLARTPEKAPRGTSRSVRATREPVNLDDRIKHLECYIASASAANRTHRAMMADYVPAEESRRSKRGNGRRPMHNMQLARRRSAALFMQVIILGTVIAAAVGWMNQRFHFWN
jgi:hypothetical protein